MELRRMLTSAAAAGVLTSLALTAPAGHAAADAASSDGGSPTPSTTSVTPAPRTATATPTTPAPSPTLTTLPATTTSGKPSPGTSATATSPAETGGPSAPPSGDADVTATPTLLPSPTGTSPTPTGSPGTDPDEDLPGPVCGVADFDVTLTGLPAAVPAGATTEPFTVTLDNTAGVDATRVQFGLAVAFRDGLHDSDWLAAQRHVTVEYFDWNDRGWQSAASGGGVYAYTDVGAGRTYEMRLRLVLAPDTPPGAAGALAFSTRWNTDGPPGSPLCVQDNEWYRFEITAPYAAAATTDVRPQGGRPPTVLRPEHPTDAPAGTRLPDGALADTGTGPDLPLLVPVSAAALALGAGALRLAARHRRDRARPTV